MIGEDFGFGAFLKTRPQLYDVMQQQIMRVFDCGARTVNSRASMYQSLKGFVSLETGSGTLLIKAGTHMTFAASYLIDFYWFSSSI